MINKNKSQLLCRAIEFFGGIARCDNSKIFAHRAFFFFFFQAVDGIRDVAVTGVQTCALPIYIDWLQQRDWSRAERFWREYLKGFKAATPLVVSRIFGDSPQDRLAPTYVGDYE